MHRQEGETDQKERLELMVIVMVVMAMMMMTMVVVVVMVMMALMMLASLICSEFLYLGEKSVSRPTLNICGFLALARD